MIALQVLAEGVKEVVIVTELNALAVGLHDRKYLAQVQTRLRDVAGVSGDHL